MKTASVPAEKEKADAEITMPGALLDVDDYKLTGSVHDHTNAIRIMKNIMFPLKIRKGSRASLIRFIFPDQTVSFRIRSKENAFRMLIVWTHPVPSAERLPGKAHGKKMYDSDEKPELNMNGEEYRIMKAQQSSIFMKSFCIQEIS